MQNVEINLKEAAGNETDRSIILAQGRNKCRVLVKKEIRQTSVTFKVWEFLQLLREKKTGSRISTDCCSPCAGTDTG